VLTDPDNVSMEFKRWMGQRDRKNFPAAQREFSAEELSAEILKSLKEDVRRQTGTNVTSAVVTVPAAFGALQCEATARAAQIAGLEQAPLLQEPIAAAIGYGAQPGVNDQRWLVFDLGGGTLDVAVVSTRDGHLNVLEHRGDNLLGGKDIDRLIVDQVLLPALEQNYDLRGLGPNSVRNALIPRLRIKAEEAKIDLSTASDVVVSLFDLGHDDSGNLIDLEISLKRSQLESLIEPLFDKCMTLVEEALSGARISGTDLDRILLVGGPTQTPFLRSLLTSRLGVPVDFSADPMTVVGRGAAIYASTLERLKVSSAQQTLSPEDDNTIKLKLAFEPVSAELETIVAGKIDGPGAEAEIKIEAEGGLWTSGWIKPADGFFETPVPLKEGAVTTFWIYARDSHGHLLQTDTTEFKVRHGLVPSAPPLPHTLSIEILSAGGKPELDPVFPKGTPLPTERTVKYRATHTVVPDNPNSDLAIKLWEGEFYGEPDANEWVGNMVLSNTEVRRSIPEGSELNITIRIDVSRLITVEVFVPHLNQHFSERVYVAKREEQDFAKLSSDAVAETATLRQRLGEIEETVSTVPDDSVQREVEDLRRTIDELTSKAPEKHQTSSSQDPDEARRVVEQSKTIKGRLSRLESRASETSTLIKSSRFASEIEIAEEVVAKFGANLEQQQLKLLRRELEKAVEKNNDKAMERACSEIIGLRWRVLGKQDWFWKEIFDSLRQPDTPFVDTREAEKLFARGDAAIRSGDGDSLRETVRELWKLQPKSEAEVTRDRALRSGLRKY